MAVPMGVFPVVPTPFTPDGAVDLAAFPAVIDFALAAGADGLVFPGMASEVETLSDDERRMLVRALGAHIAGRRPIIVGASDADPAKAAAHAEAGRAIGAVAAMVMAPNRLAGDVAGQIAYFQAVAAATALPIMLQNAPAPMGAGLSPEDVARIATAVAAIRFVKEETLPCGQNVERILKAAGPAIDAVYGGGGARYVLDEMQRGAAGTMPAIEIADLHVAMLAAWKRGDSATARRLYTDTLPLLAFQMVFRVRATKEVLRRRGILSCTAARARGPVLDDGDRRELGELLATVRPHCTIHIPQG